MCVCAHYYCCSPPSCHPALCFRPTASSAFFISLLGLLLMPDLSIALLCSTTTTQLPPFNEAASPALLSARLPSLVR